MPEKMSMEKVRVLKGLGAEIVRTRTSGIFYQKMRRCGVTLSKLKFFSKKFLENSKKFWENFQKMFEKFGIK